ncbi:uncharacterized protein LOC133926484 isoform X2 [Phragmites australis]|uniref:uncharacterized protein LOC133926484 isoform X2 n=1 Tax=Phragmites australis TaxID=29695 RepID=UPI002D769301|nr:uncharacterized protein LOC133926484 isoform X2 [Phragmites australis]
MFMAFTCVKRITCDGAEPSSVVATSRSPRPNRMVSATAVAFLALCASFIAVQVPSFSDQPGTTNTPAQAAPSNGALQVMLPLATMETIFTAVAFIYGHQHHAAAAAGNWRLSEFIIFILCPLIGRLEFFLFVQQPVGGVDDAAHARALGMAAVHVLPAAATVTFFLGMALVFVHVCAGGGGAVAEDGPIQAVLGVLPKMVLGAAAALISLMAMVVYAKW